MLVIGVLLILTAPDAAPNHQDGGAARDVYRCGFEQDADRNYDRWPDGWTRRRDRFYPHYVAVGIVPSPEQAEAPSAGSCLEIQLDGAAAAVFSPAIKVDAMFSYSVALSMRSRGLRDSKVTFRLTMRDDQGNVALSRELTPPPADQWTSLSIGPIAPGDANIVEASVALHVEPTRRADFHGAVWFDDLVVTRHPRMALSTNRPFNWFVDGEAVEARCKVSGVSSSESSLMFELVDVDNQVIQREQAPLTPAAGEDASGAVSATATWRPTVPGRGWYRILVGMEGASLRRSLYFAVLDDRALPASHQVGWALPAADSPLSLSALTDLIGRSNVGWVKFPVWGFAEDDRKVDQMGRFSERLAASDVNLVGMLDRPPASARSRFRDNGNRPIAELFNEDEGWRTALKPVMSNLSLNIRWWQLGADDDTSFVGHENRQAKVSEVQTYMRRHGRESQLGVSWNWMHETPSELPRGTALKFFSHTIDPELPDLTAEELSSYLNRPRSSHAQTWVSLRPLPKSRYDTRTRAADLVRRMVAAQIHGAQATFIADPFDPERGLFERDGSPGPLFLPWRVTATALRDAARIGSVALPEESESHLFLSGMQAVAVVWNPVAAEEAIYLGEDVRQIDLWGRELTPAIKGGKQVVTVGPTPTFLTGVDARVARWRLACKLNRRQFTSVFGRPLRGSLHLQNPFPMGVSGEASLHAPQVWTVAERRLRFKLAQGESLDVPFTAFLKSDASSGTQKVRIDFDVQAERRHRFSVHRTIQIGNGEFDVQMTSRIDEDGRLLVVQQLTNHSAKAVSFNCQLFAPHRKRQRQTIIGLGVGQTSREFLFRDGEELIGKTLLLRVEEIDGPRVFNYRHTVR